jgi:glucose/arabinose dehydrogenase
VRRAAKVVVGATLIATAAAGVGLLLLPDRFAVNAPLGQWLFGLGLAAPAEDAVVARLEAPKGWRVGLFAADLPNARFLRFTPGGDLLVSQPRGGRVVLLEADHDGDGRSDGRRDVVTGLNRPHGMDLRDGWLYVAEADAVGRIRFDGRTGRTTGAFDRVVTGLPGGGNHWTRTLRFGPDGWMYVSIGSSCNVCRESDPRRASIMRFHPDGTGGEIYATGLRNAVGFDWRPEDGELYATDNGRDLLGDDFPPCELDHVVQGGFYGWPVANGNRVPDPDFGKGAEARIAASIPPVHGFRAHNAPLGITFLRGQDLPEDYRGAALVALHGSWNRTRKDGYEVVSLHWRADGAIEERDFLTGFLDRSDDEVVGRPVDVAEGPDGAVYVSDDYAGAVYRVSRGRAAKTPGEVARGGLAAGPATAGKATAVSLPADVERRGRGLWESQKCGVCHDAKKAVKGMVTRPLGGLAKRYTPETLAAYLVAPNPPMPAFDRLSEAERTDLARYLLARHP